MSMNLRNIMGEEGSVCSEHQLQRLMGEGVFGVFDEQFKGQCRINGEEERVVGDLELDHVER